MRGVVARESAMGESIKALRESRGWSQREVERRTDSRVRSSHLSQIENGKVAEPSLSVLRELAEAFNLRLGVFLALIKAVEHPHPDMTATEALVLSYLRDLDEGEQQEVVRFLTYFAGRSRNQAGSEPGAR